MTKQVFLQNLFTKQVYISTYLPKWCSFILFFLIYPMRAKTSPGSLSALIDLSQQPSSHSLSQPLISTSDLYRRSPTHASHRRPPSYISARLVDVMDSTTHHTYYGEVTREKPTTHHLFSRRKNPPPTMVNSLRSS